MTNEEAFKTIQKQAPCPHDNTDTGLGDGKTWAKCEDCGALFLQDDTLRVRAEAQQFEDAIAHLRAEVCDHDFDWMCP